MDPGARIAIDNAPNLRDFGGWRTSSGETVREGQAIARPSLNYLHDANLTAFARLAIRTR